MLCCLALHLFDIANPAAATVSNLREVVVCFISFPSELAFQITSPFSMENSLLVERQGWAKTNLSPKTAAILCTRVFTWVAINNY